MILGPAYPAARLVAPKVVAHFTRHGRDAIGRSVGPVAPLPDAATIEALIDAAFWASLRREETYVPKISLAYVPPDIAPHPLLFERPLSLSAAALVKVAPAVERAGIHLGVWRDPAPGGGDALLVWGTIRTIPTLSVVVEVAAPGLLVVKHHRGEAGKFINVAVLEGDRVKVIDEQASSLPDCPPLLSSLLGFDSPASWDNGVDSVNILVQLAVSMRAHGRGGVLLMVPPGSDAWQDSIVRPIPYAVAPAFAELAVLNREPPELRQTRAWREAVYYTVQAIAGLTAVDGATVMTSDYELVAFGAKWNVALVQGEYWRLVTAGFLHGGILHILMNSWVLFDLGAQVEELYGSSRMLVIYFLSTVGGFYASAVWSVAVSVGASAGLFGLVGAMIALGLRHRNAMGAAIRGMYLRGAVIGLAFGMVGAFHVDNAAHIGGLLSVLWFRRVP